MKYFKSVQSLADLKNQYRKLAIELHPDRGGDEEKFKEMGNEFSLLYAVWKDRKDEFGKVRKENVSDSSCDDFMRGFCREQGWTGSNRYKYDNNAKIVADVREYAKMRFPQFTFSITQDNRGSYTSSINVNLMQSPYKVRMNDDVGKVYAGENINHYHLDSHGDFTPEVLDALKDVWAYLQSFNYDHSNIMMDYFNRGFYGSLAIGKCNKPYKVEVNRKFRAGGAAPKEFKWRTGKAHAAINKAMGANMFGSAKHFERYRDDDRLFFGPKCYDGKLSSVNDYGPVAVEKIREKLLNVGIIVGLVEHAHVRWADHYPVKHYNLYFDGYTSEVEAALAREDKEREDAYNAFLAGESAKKETPKPECGKVDGVTIEDYSEKAFAVFGDTRAIAENLKSAGGKFNRNLRGRAGWIFSKKREDKVREILNIA